jgi:UDP-N-acetylglucosamine transferase subunit ALG13
MRILEKTDIIPLVDARLNGHSSPQPLVVCLLGTDHHPFDRLVSWMDAWAERHPQVRVLVQHGATTGPRCAQGVQLLAYQDLQATLAGATAAVCHGGPGTIADIRRHGLRPVVVPRASSLGEHVDDHQLQFADFMARSSVVDLADREAALHQLLDVRLTEGRPTGASAADDPAVETSRRFGLVVDEVLARPQRRRRG